MGLCLLSFTQALKKAWVFPFYRDYTNPQGMEYNRITEFC